MSRPRERDYAYEALAEVTNSHLEGNRGELNISLKTIREQAKIDDSYALADEIHKRAKQYRELMGGEVLLTPTALAKHWLRVSEVTVQRQQRDPRGENRHGAPTECPTCNGDRFVVVALRPARVEDVPGYEETAPCPDCNGQEITWRRYDGRPMRTPDAAAIREMLRR